MTYRAPIRDLAFTLQAVRGLGIAAMDIASTTVLQREVPAELHGRVFACLYGLLGASAAVSYVAGGVLLDATDARTTLVLAGSLGVVVTLATLPAVLTRRRYAAPGST